MYATNSRLPPTLSVKELISLPLPFLFDRGTLPHHIPINLLPPCLQIVRLACDPVVLQPRMLPGVDAQQGHDVCAAEGLRGLGRGLSGVLSESTDAVQLLERVVVVRVQVVRLPPEVCAGER